MVKKRLVKRSLKKPAKKPAKKPIPAVALIVLAGQVNRLTQRVLYLEQCWALSRLDLPHDPIVDDLKPPPLED